MILDCARLALTTFGIGLVAGILVTVLAVSLLGVLRIAGRESREETAR